ncbi:6-phosphogluconolactonase [Limnohabitans sp. B9-3]|uniref:6-phosphogluconolactonase n=1 Tax=Limnohabitans sp. B9-3 TaxID=1100707 RepID=UPI000C1EF5E9|nr:6-phosphogluconolactonase [Limnohabitans sp. B9-3]PIT77799.1 6-phosphogluconolactonase [Limnohabitans sp. B9-3]
MSAAASLNSSTPLPFWQDQTLPQVTVKPVATDALNARLAQDIAQRLNAAISARGVAVLSVSGGKSPIALFEALRVQAVDWAKVRVTLVDERCVPNTHPDSNALLVQTHLLQGLAAQAQLVPMVSAATSDAPNINDVPLLSPVVQAKVAGIALVAAGIADVLVLGMGTDGHTASLFPDAPNLQDALDLRNTQACVAIELAHPPANAPYARVTQTLAQILSARHILLPISGVDKRHTLQQAWGKADARYPVSYVLHQTQTPVALWLTP